MSDSKLPQIQQPSSPPENSLSHIAYTSGLRQSRLLLVAGLTTACAAVADYFLSQHIFLSLFLAMLGIVFFIARQLVRNSIALTSHAKSERPDSPVARLEEIRKQTSKCKFLENVEQAGTEAAEQATQLIQQYKNLQTVLAQKFEPGELTRARYSDGIIFSCLAIGENLLLAKSLLENMNVTKPKGTAAAFQNSAAETNVTLSRSQDLWAQQEKQVTDILSSNAAALSGLATLFGSLNQMTTKEKYRDELEHSMQQIRVLAERAKQYSKQ